MAVAAAKDCLRGLDSGKVDGCYFATTSQTYALRQNAGIIAAALDLNTNCRTADFTDSTKSGTAAFLAAVDAVATGQARNAFCAVRPPGHHALRDKAMGFCLFNNVAIAARYAQEKHHLGKVLIVDADSMDFLGNPEDISTVIDKINAQLHGLF